MEAEDDGHLLVPGEALQDGQKLGLALDVKEGRRLVQQDQLRLLADGPGQQHALALAVTDAVEVPSRQRFGSHEGQRGVDLPPVLRREDAQPPRVGVAPGGGHLETGGQLGAAGVGHHQGHLPGALRAGVVRKALSVQQDSAPLRGQLGRQRLEEGRFARTVGSDEGEDAPLFGSEADVLHQGRFAVADGKVIGAAEGFFFAHSRPPSVWRRTSSQMTTGAPKTAVTELMDSSVGANRLRAIRSQSRQNAAPPRQQPGRT